MLIAIDAGHGGKDPGAIGNGLLEKEITLKLALKTGVYLRTHYDCDVMYTRNRDVFLSLSERVHMANLAKADLFCSFHINSLNADSEGFETFRYPGTTGETAVLQQLVHSEVMKVMNNFGIPDRGVKQQDLAVLRETVMPALLTETMFISNPDEAKLLKSETFLEQVAQAHAVGLAKAARLRDKDENRYYLVTGTFATKEHAEEQAQRLRDMYGWLIHVKER
ncbi:N-acetylmuramoyl-L-alanine amidase family protein [Bacillus dakarensis]|uniref:N-acetylmuramoyl-L-alanine amidase family protein n=1 Tax=Robertmurraya dakarensis TaxID=1926278 RepID=UPI000980C4FC|nr:N-acetylmuramoyl-L-alanine amidase [Bacillus dakarensis]